MSAKIIEFRPRKKDAEVPVTRDLDRTKEFEERIARLRESIDKINGLMDELKTKTSTKPNEDNSP